MPLFQIVIMKTIFTGLVLLMSTVLFSQNSLTAESFGFRHIQIPFKGDQVDILVKSKKGEELLKKPLFFYVQGSTARPLIVHNGKFRVTAAMTEGFFEEDFHYVILSKPGLPLVVHESEMTNRNYKDENTNKPPTKYIEDNNLEYYTERNLIILDSLISKPWVDTSRIVVAGHSEGSTIAAYMAAGHKSVTHLIYSGGLPYFSRILAMVVQDRKAELNGKKSWVKETYSYWKDVMEHPDAIDRNEGWDSNKSTYSFSKSENDILKSIKIPILVSFGTFDEAAPFNDMFHIEVISERIQNIDFKEYVGKDHYYVSSEGEDHLDTVMSDWKEWLQEN